MASIKVGLLVPESGTAGLWAPSAWACANLAVRELNDLGGILRRPVELIAIDAGTTGASAAYAARQAVDVDGVSALIGMFPSYARDSVRRAVGETVPLIYTPQFEGLEHDLDIISTGETSHELLRPAIEWLMQNKGVSRFFLCGSDYVWPRLSFQIAKSIIRDLGGTVVGERYLPLNETDFGAAMDAIRMSACDIVLPHFLGQDAVAFNRAYGEMRLASQALRLASAVDETVVYGLDENATENLFVASAYFSSLRSRNNGAFLERYHTSFGDSPPPANAYGQSCYEGLFCLAGLVEAAGSLETRRVRAAVGQSRQRKSARGNDLAPLTGGRHPIHLARVDGYDIRLVGSL
ncbi:substrate-binding domain-containing protein [Rhizobium sp. 2MFCol3.1]|uniref:substrate-binding domain-containing protein n=1 Tax=Rhizobium sp. 2MFCol3.1 TaxID=1246459 RepID=UPI0003A1174F|nr:substrate-binding domain-containing protein [Rhizobium sp. 2MFCol3.1]